MPSIHIRGVPVETLAVLRRRAAAANQPLQEYLRSRLIELTSRPTLDEALYRIEGRAGGAAPPAVVLATLREDRNRR